MNSPGITDAGEVERGRELLEEATELARALDDDYREAYPLTNLARLALQEGDVAAARPMLERALAVFSGRGDQRPCAYVLGSIAIVEALAGRPERAARLAGASATLFASIGGRLVPVMERQFDECVSRCRTSMSDESFAAAWAGGRAMGFDEVVEYALARGRDGATPLP